MLDKPRKQVGKVTIEGAGGYCAQSGLNVCNGNRIDVCEKRAIAGHFGRWVSSPRSRSEGTADRLRGAYCRFAPGAAHELGELLRAVAAYAAGGIKVLAALQARSAGAHKLIEQMR